jgi:hypothetical protein
MGKGFCRWREWSGNEWMTEEGFQRGSRALYGQGRLGLGWTLADAIGHRGWHAGAASCAKSRGQVGGVGDWPVQLRHGRF